MIEKFKKLVESYKEDTHLRIALAEITFKFPANCKYPNLSVRIEGFGLFNPLEGRTVSTLPEIWLAIYLGAEIIYHDAVIIEDLIMPTDSIEFSDDMSYFCRTHLKKLFDLRSNAKKSNEELLQQLYKTYSNSLYGKLAQGIAEKSMFNTRSGATAKLPKSTITNSYYASMTTGLIRAALSELHVAIEELIQEGHNYKIISATTDGLLYGIDSNKISAADTLDMEHKSYTFNSIGESLKNGYSRFKAFDMVDPILATKIKKFPSLQLLKLSHEAWDDPEYIEIKHVANKMLNFKTRGQVGYYMLENKEVCTILAKAGHKISGTKEEQASWIMTHYEDDSIQNYSFTTLSSIQDILNVECVIDDLVSLPTERIISLDYDYKRCPVSKHDTAPHKDINQFMKFRQSVDYLKRLKQRATIDAVDYKYKRAEQRIRSRGSNKTFCARHIIRGLLHNVEPFEKLELSYKSLAYTLREFGVTLSQVKHAKGARFTPFMIQDTSGNRSHIRKILKALGYQKDKSNYANFLELLLHKKISNPEDVSYLD